MAKKETILTSEGLAELERELEELKGPKRKELSARLKVAISFGDLKENSEYHSAKDDQAFMETRILELERILRSAKIVDSSEIAGQVGVGSIVTLLDVEFNEQIEYRIVGPAEANVAENKISYESPLGSSLIGKKVGETVEVNAPAGVIPYKILEIKA